MCIMPMIHLFLTSRYVYPWNNLVVVVWYVDAWNNPPVRQPVEQSCSSCPVLRCVPGRAVELSQRIHASCHWNRHVWMVLLYRKMRLLDIENDQRMERHKIVMSVAAHTLVETSICLCYLVTLLMARRSHSWTDLLEDGEASRKAG